MDLNPHEGVIHRQDLPSCLQRCFAYSKIAPQACILIPCPSAAPFLFLVALVCHPELPSPKAGLETITLFAVSLEE